MFTWYTRDALVQRKCLIKFTRHFNKGVSITEEGGAKSFLHVNISTFEVNNHDVKVQIVR